MRNLKYFVAHQEEVKVKTFDELREAKTVDLQETSTKVKTTMPDKVASSATRFGLKAKSQGGSVSISGPKGKLNDFLRAIIGRSSYGDASELDEANESVEMNEQFVVKYAKNKRGPIYQTKFKTQPEAEKFLDQKKKEGMNGIVSKAGKPVSMQKMADLQKESVDLDEALQSVTKIKFDYKDTMPKNAKPSDVGGLKQDWNNDRTAVRSAVKPLGGLVTDSEAPSRTNKFVGTLSVGTRGDASKLSNSAIQKAVKSKGAEIQNSQFMSESVESLDENYRTLATHGMGAETKNTINVGRDVDYYDSTGTKRMGKITKMTRSGYVVKDEKDGKSHAFAFHDRAKAKEILAKSK